MSSKPESAHLARALGVRDVALFMVTAGCSLYWSGGHANPSPDHRAEFPPRGPDFLGNNRLCLDGAGGLQDHGA